MKKLVLILAVFCGPFSYGAGLPDIVQNLRVSFGPNDCGPSGPEVPVQYMPPPPAYDHGITEWTSLYRTDIHAENQDPTDGYGYFRTYDFYVQARFPMQGGAIWSSTTGLYHDRFPFELDPFEIADLVHTKRFTYYGTVAGIGQMPLVGTTVYFRCLGGQDYISQQFNGPVTFNSWSPASLVKLTYQDLL